MVERAQITDVNTKTIAKGLREMADEIEKGGMIAFVAVGCDGEGQSMLSCIVDQNRCEHDLLDEMVEHAKHALFDSYEDET
jgi:uncharacterized protein YebE (UPF0316 family)